MSKVKKAFHYLFNQPSILTEELFIRYARYRDFDDETYLKKLYFLRKWKKLNLENPKTFSEKCQWLKLYDRKPVYQQMVDKYYVKKLVAQMIGEEYVIPTYGVWERVEDIDWDSLPDKFCIKPTHCGGACCILICKDKSKFDIEKAKVELKKTMYSNGIWQALREWTYKDIKPRIIAEQLLEDDVLPYPQDYKFYCFNGEPKLVEVVANRGRVKTVSDYYFDANGNYLPIQHVGYPNSPNSIPGLPKNFYLMLDLARKLANDVPHLRVDLYEVNGKVYLGELTFAEESGFAEFKPKKWNYILGDWIKLPQKLIYE